MVEGELVAAAGIGVALWGAGVVLLKICGEEISKKGNKHLLGAMYAAQIPAGILSYHLMVGVTKTPWNSSDALREWATAITTALLIDGCAFGFMEEQTYNLSTHGMHYSAATVLWAAGITGAYALWATQ